jgi:hypothetical protein
VGTLSPTETGSGCASATYAVISSGTDHSGATCDTSGGTNFTVTGAAVTANSPSPAGAGTYTNECFQATVSGATGSPYTQAFTITGAATALPALQAINSGSTQTNVPFSIGIPFDVSMVDSSHHITASDSTNGALTCDEANRYSDIGGLNSGTPQVRGTTLSCNIPSWPNGADNITLAIASGAPGSGTDISTSDLTTANFDLTVTVVTQAGTTETAQLSTAFANVGFVDITTPAILGKWRSGGGVVTGYVFFMPFKNGGTADPKGLYGLFDVECYKAHTGAVNVSTNPILGCHIDLLTGNGVAELSSPLASDYNLLAYGISFTGGSGGATTFTNWASTAPTQTLTFTNISTTATITATLGAGTLTGNTHTNSTIDNLSVDPASLGVFNGMLIGDTAGDIPYPTHVASFTSTTITLDNNTTGSHTGTQLTSPAFIAWNTGLSDPNADALGDNQVFFLANSGGALPTGFSAGTPYVLITKGISSGVETITASTVIGGPIINTTSAGSGTHTIWPQVIGSVAASSPLFTSDSVGTVIWDGTFYGVITNFTDSTHVDISVYRPEPGLTTMTSGGYHFLPINHPYAARMRFSGNWVNAGSAAPLRVQNGNLYLGDAWNGSTSLGGPGPYFRSAKALPNYNIGAPGNDPDMPTFAATYNNCPPSEGLSASCNGSILGWNQGHNPSAYGSVSSIPKTSACGGVTMGPYIGPQQSSGDNGFIYFHPSWNVIGAFKYDQYAALAIFEDSDKFAFSTWGMISNALGAYPASDVNSYGFSAINGNTVMASVSGWVPSQSFGYNNTCFTDNPNGAHAANQFALPYQMTGDWYLLSHEVNYAFAQAGALHNGGGVGLNQHWVGAAGAGDEERSGSWPMMIQADMISFLPDSDTSTSSDAYKVLGGLTKTDAITWQTAQWLSTGGGAKNYLCANTPNFFNCPGTIYSPGVNASCPAGGTCNPGFTNFSTPDIRFLGPSGGGFGFETGYWYNVFGIVAERGMCDANCRQAWQWMMQGQSSYVLNTSNPSFPGSAVAAGTIEHLDTSAVNTCNWYNTGADAPTWANCWRAAVVTGTVGITDPPINRYPSGTATLSATTGTITVTIPTGYIASGGTAFYTGGFFFTSDNGFCRITTVNSATQFGCTVVNTYGSTSYTNTSVPSNGQLDGITLFWEIPQPAGGDSVGLEAAYLVAHGVPGAGGNRYANIQQSGCIMANEYIGYPLSSTCDIINNFSTYPDPAGFPTQANAISFNIAPR